MIRKQLQFLRSKVIVIDGTIACGKTSLGSHIATMLNSYAIPAVFLEEFVDNDILSMFIKNPKKHAAMFSMLMLEKKKTTFFNAHKIAGNGFCVIIDRSLYGNKPFAIVNKPFFSFVDWQYYVRCFNRAILATPRGDYGIALDVSLEDTKIRIKRRNRQSEVNGYTHEYLSHLYIEYKKVIPEKYLHVDFSDKYRYLNDKIVVNILLQLE